MVSKIDYREDVRVGERGAWSKLTIRDTSCCCRPLTDVLCLRSGPRRNRGSSREEPEDAADRERSWSMQQIWTVLQRAGPDHLGLRSHMYQVSFPGQSSLNVGLHQVRTPAASAHQAL